MILEIEKATVIIFNKMIGDKFSAFLSKNAILLTHLNSAPMLDFPISFILKIEQL